MREFNIFVVLLYVFNICIAQRVAPGVPPQHYQNDQMHQVPQHQAQYQPSPHHQPQQQQQFQQGHHQVPVQQQHQVPVQHHQQQQQVPVHQQQQHQQQHQQAPPIQHQQQIPHQQEPHGHHHGGHGGQPSVLNTGNMEHEKQHIAEHMDVPIDTSKMSEQELQFHYFKMHDADNNNRLDGCELIKSLIHWHEQGSKEQPQPGAQHVEEKIFTDDELIALIDPILNMDDGNRDGFIDYPEFVKAQQKAQQQPQQPNP